MGVFDAIARRRAPARVWHGWRAALDRLPVVAVDVETNGLDARRDHVLEVALVADGKTVMESLVRPPRGGVGEGPHGLTDELLIRAPTFAELAGALATALAGRLIVGHHAAFDVAFLRAELARAGRPAPALPYLCTATLPRLLGLDHPTRRLDWACEHFRVLLDRPHEAACDARAATALFAAYNDRARAECLGLPELAARSPRDACVLSWARPPLRPGPVAVQFGRPLTRTDALAA